MSKLTSEISAGEHFAKDRGGRLYIYRDGVYRLDAEEFVARRIIEELDAVTQRDLWSMHVASEVVGFIRTQADPVEEDPGEHSINVLNGLVDIASGVLRPHSPTSRSTIQLPIKYDPVARCVAIERFFSDVLPPDCVKENVGFEIFAATIAVTRALEKAIFLLGGGSNGKSLLTEIVLAMLGTENASYLPLQKIADNRFAAASLFGKPANLCTDMPASTLSDTGMFKRITSGEVIDAEVKYGQSFQFRPFARLLFSLNQFPRVTNVDEAVFRRLHIVPFERTFPPDPAKRAQLLASLTDPDELSGAFNRTLEALRKIRVFGLAQPLSITDALAEVRGVIDPMEAFLANYCDETPGGVCTKKELLRTFNATAARAGRAPMTMNGFTRHLHNIRPTFKQDQRVIAGHREWVWLGVELRTP